MAFPKACRRIQRELAMYKESPSDFVPKIHIQDNNMYKVYFKIEGPSDSDYAGGEYVGVLKLDADYPMTPPEIQMLTPSGRFVVKKPICTTFTNFHPESWCASYTFSSILTSFVSFMLEDNACAYSAVGSIASTPSEKRQFASESKAFNKLNGFDTW